MSHFESRIKSLDRFQKKIDRKREKWSKNKSKLEQNRHLQRKVDEGIFWKSECSKSEQKMNDTVQTLDSGCVRNKNCTSEMYAETYNTKYLYRRYTESWIAALVAFLLLLALFTCKILTELRSEPTAPVVRGTRLGKAWYFKVYEKLIRLWIRRDMHGSLIFPRHWCLRNQVRLVPQCMPSWLTT